MLDSYSKAIHSFHLCPDRKWSLQTSTKFFWLTTFILYGNADGSDLIQNGNDPMHGCQGVPEWIGE